MKSYIVSYDLKDSSDNYDELIDKIKSYPRWAHINKSVWLVKSNTSAADIRDNLRKVIDSKDSIFVGGLTGEAAWSNIICSSEALKERI
ncbi:CRISPR-associated protein Cas2 [Lactococcus petauri]|uniref:CRISPR-associated protein Cas2 n=1 Tax=Lactococcus petauri TaxID=1940789 RepID=UPI0038550104